MVYVKKFARYGSQPVWLKMDLRDLSISEMARRIDVPRKMLHNVLHGNTRPHPVVVVRLCEYMGMTPEEAFWPDTFATPYGRYGPRWQVTRGAFQPELDAKWRVFLDREGYWS